MIEISYTRKFIRQYHRLDTSLQTELKEKITLFSRDPNHSILKTHPLKGRMKGLHAFSVNYKMRIIFEYANREKTATIMLSVGNHDMYH